MLSHAGTALVLTASACMAPAISTPSAVPAPSTRPVGLWVASGWTPAHRMCEMDVATIPHVQRWRCVRSGKGWELHIQVASVGGDGTAPVVAREEDVAG